MFNNLLARIFGSRNQRILKSLNSLVTQGIEVIRRNDVLILRGEVESARRRDEIMRLVGERFPRLRIHNDIGVTRANAPAEAEEL